MSPTRYNPGRSVRPGTGQSLIPLKSVEARRQRLMAGSRSHTEGGTNHMKKPLVGLIAASVVLASVTLAANAQSPYYPNATTMQQPQSYTPYGYTQQQQRAGSGYPSAYGAPQVPQQPTQGAETAQRAGRQLPPGAECWSQGRPGVWRHHRGGTGCEPLPQ